MVPICKAGGTAIVVQQLTQLACLLIDVRHACLWSDQWVCLMTVLCVVRPVGVSHGCYVWSDLRVSHHDCIMCGQTCGCVSS